MFCVVLVQQIGSISLSRCPCAGESSTRHYLYPFILRAESKTVFSKISCVLLKVSCSMYHFSPLPVLHEVPYFLLHALECLTNTASKYKYNAWSQGVYHTLAQGQGRYLSRCKWSATALRGNDTVYIEAFIDGGSTVCRSRLPVSFTQIAMHSNTP